MDIRAGKSQQYNQLCETCTLAAYSYQQMKKIPASRNWYGTGMMPLRNHNHFQRLVPPFFKPLITLRTPGRNTAPPVSSNITQRSLASIASLIHLVKTKLRRLTCHRCVGRTKGRSHSFVLEFSLVTFFVSRQRK